jgi:hypothetical protein
MIEDKVNFQVAAAQYEAAKVNDARLNEQQ